MFYKKNTNTQQKKHNNNKKLNKGERKEKKSVRKKKMFQKDSEFKKEFEKNERYEKKKGLCKRLFKCFLRDTGEKRGQTKDKKILLKTRRGGKYKQKIQRKASRRILNKREFVIKEGLFFCKRGKLLF